MLIRSPDDLEEDQRPIINTLLTECNEVKVAYELTQQFCRMVREHHPEWLKEWLLKAFASSLPEFRNFAKSIVRDRNAVEAALTLPWSNGPTEGHVNRLKVIKRQMYGRANFDLLRLRVLHPP